MHGEWQDYAVRLWGDDWIAPLSEVLHVNRRTVERWKSGDVEIPRHIAVAIIQTPQLGMATRAYGDVLRRVARGETVDELEQWLADQKRALARYKVDRERGGAIAVFAAVAGYDAT